MVNDDEVSIDELAAAFLDLDMQREKIIEQQDAIKDALRTRLDDGSYNAGGARITISAPVRRFDPKRAELVIPDELRKACERTSIDATLAKAYLPPVLYEQCQVSSAGAQRVVRVR